MDGIGELLKQISAFSLSKGINELEAKDALMSALTSIYTRQVFIGEDGGFYFGDNTRIPYKNIKKIERKLIFNISRLVAKKKYEDIKKQLKMSNNVVEAKVLSYSKKQTVIEWDSMMFVIDSSNFRFFRRMPHTNDTIKLFVVKTNLDIKNINEPITLEFSTRNKGFLQKEIAHNLGLETNTVKVITIDIKKIYINITHINPIISEKMLLLPYRLFINEK